MVKMVELDRKAFALDVSPPEAAIRIYSGGFGAIKSSLGIPL